MKKIDKKIISIFLVLIILISQFSPIIATEEYDGYDLLLEQYLIGNGVDEDGDKKISDEEWKKVKNLDLRDYAYLKSTDLTGIEKAVNLKMLRVMRAELSGIDFSKFKNLKELYISECSLEGVEISGLEELTTLKIYDSNLENCKIEKLKNLELTIGYSKLKNCKIENVENFESATLVDLNMEEIDLTKIKNVKNLSISLDNDEMSGKIDLDFTEFKNLEILDINDENPYKYNSDKKEYVNEYFNIVNNINISGLSNLKELYLSNTYNCNIEFSGLNDIEIFDVDNNKIDNIDFTNYKKLEKVSVLKFGEILGKEDFKIGENFIAKIGYKSMKGDALILEKQEDVVEMVENEHRKIFIYSDWIDSLEILSGDDILEFVKDQYGYWYLITKGIGEQKIKVIDELEREHEILIRVVKNNVNTKLENSGITAKSIVGSLILKSNGELWNVNSETTAEMLDTNVKKYIADEVYLSSENYRGNSYATLYNDNKLVIEYFEGDRKTINNVKDIGQCLYITNDGKLYEYSFCYVTEECKIKFVMDNMEKIINDRSYSKQFIISKDGKTFEKYRNGDCIKVLDVEAKNYRGSVKNETSNGVEYVEVLTDINGEKWINSSRLETKWRKVNESDNLIEAISGFSSGRLLTLSKNKTAHLIYRGENEEEILNAPLILTDVEEIIDCYFGGNTDVLIRTDGSIWIYSSTGGLTKITKSTPEKEEIPEEFIINSEIKEKIIGNEDCITGLELNENDTITVKEFIAQNNLNNKYTVKICDSNGDELKEDSLIGTGTRVELYAGDKLVKEYIIIIYGDIDGDAEITPADALNLIKILNEKIEPESQAHVEAGKLSEESELTPADALRIIKHLNKKYEITQNI